MNETSKTYIWIVVAVVIVSGGIILFSQRGSNTTSNSTSNNLYPEQAISHGHGLAVDVENSNKLYIATHYGLLVLMNEKDLFRVGKSRDDYMGFSPHPTEADIFFSSGHPNTGGNIGFQKSEDGGVTWKKISNGVNGPVDFHAMAISPVNPNLIYGWYQGNLQKSSDGGMTWEAYATDFPVLSLAADPEDEKIVYAITPLGVLISNDHGASWTDNFTGGTKGNSKVFAFAVHPRDARQMLMFSEEFKLEKSVDKGKTWQGINEGFNGEAILHIAFNRSEPNIIYALTNENKLYKSTDTGDTWIQIR